MPYCEATSASIGFPIDIPIVWGNRWLKKLVASENGVQNVGDVFKLVH